MLINVIESNFATSDLLSHHKNAYGIVFKRLDLSAGSQSSTVLCSFHFYLPCLVIAKYVSRFRSI